VKVDIGTLNKRIEILTNDKEIYHRCWAAVNQLSGTEIAKNNIQFQQTTTRFLIRYTKKQFYNDMTIKFNGFIYDIQYSNDYNFSHEYIEIMAIKRSYMVSNNEN
jgi:SPP1 family predicted phage head-tail adaptor